jgi:hypothetical protein
VVNFLIYVATVVGVVYFVTMSSIFAPIRMPIAKIGSWVLVLMYCPSCVGFWVGWCLALSGVNPFGGATHVNVNQMIQAAIVAMGISTTWFALCYRSVNPAFEAEQVALSRAMTRALGGNNENDAAQKETEDER